MNQPLAVTSLLAAGSETDQLRELLRGVIDPELGVDIVGLGLLYDLDLHDRVAAVTMTTTTPACPMGTYLTEEVERTLLDSGSVDRVELVLTHSPAWTPEMMSDETKRMFGW